MGCFRDTYFKILSFVRIFISFWTKDTYPKDEVTMIKVYPWKWYEYLESMFSEWWLTIFEPCTLLCKHETGWRSSGASRCINHPQNNSNAMHNMLQGLLDLSLSYAIKYLKTFHENKHLWYNSQSETNSANFSTEITFPAELCLFEAMSLWLCMNVAVWTSTLWRQLYQDTVVDAMVRLPVCLFSLSLLCHNQMLLQPLCATTVATLANLTRRLLHNGHEVLKKQDWSNLHTQKLHKAGVRACQWKLPLVHLSYWHVVHQNTLVSTFILPYYHSFHISVSKPHA